MFMRRTMAERYEYMLAILACFGSFDAFLNRVLPAITMVYYSYNIMESSCALGQALILSQALHF